MHDIPKTLSIFLLTYAYNTCLHWIAIIIDDRQNLPFSKETLKHGMIVFDNSHVLFSCFLIPFPLHKSMEVFPSPTIVLIAV